ncbi:MAG: hypothetical protein WCE94_02840 [Candidatus Methanoperedens sp.]
MFEAYLKITEKDMAWSELKALCEDKKLRILSLALIDSEGRMVSDSSIAIPPDAQCALHFKTAETDMASGATELVSESVGYIDAESREITKKWDCKSNAATPKVLMSPENLVHGIKSGGI